MKDPVTFIFYILFPEAGNSSFLKNFGTCLDLNSRVMVYAHKYYSLVGWNNDGWIDGFTFLNREQNVEAGWFVAGLYAGYFIALVV